MEEDIFYCGEAVTDVDEAAWSCFVTKKEPEKIWRFKTEEEFRRDNLWIKNESGASHPPDWNDLGGMNYLIGKPVQPELYKSGRSFQAVLEAKKGKFKVVADDHVDRGREYWTVDYRDIIYDYPVE